jgi:predicted amidohydrolase YtcJ
MELLITDAEVDGHRTSVLIEGGTIREVGRHLRRRAGVESMPARGVALIPGLHDHHVHLLAAAASWSSVQVGPPDVTDAQQLRRRLMFGSRLKRSDNWIRAVKEIYED